MTASLEQKAETCRHLLDLMLSNKSFVVFDLYILSFNTCFLFIVALCMSMPTLCKNTWVCR